MTLTSLRRANKKSQRALPAISMACSFLLCLLLVSCAQDPNKISKYNNSKLIDAELKYQVPAEWKQEEPTNLMRKAQYRIEEDLLFTVYEFPGLVGGVEANVARWKKQFDKNDRQVVEFKQFNKGKLPITIFHIEGTYKEANTPFLADKSQAKDYPKHANYATIVELANSKWFFKTMGSQASMAKHKEAISSFINSLSI